MKQATSTPTRHAARRYRRTIAEMMSAVLGETPGRAAKLARQHVACRQRALTHWHRFADAPERVLQRMVNAIRFEEEAAFRALAIGDPRPLVFVSIHMGNYLGGYHRILTCVPRERRICVLRRLGASDLERRAFARYEALGLRLNVLRQSRRPALEALRALQHGDHLVTFCDLPARFGPVMSLDFLGRIAALVRAPAELAAAAGALVVPVVNHVDVHGIHRLEVRSPIVTHRTGRAGEPCNVAALAQALAGLAETWIRRHPGQWTNWPLLPEMVRVPGAANAAHSGTEVVDA